MSVATSSFQAAKLWLVSATDLAKDALHVHVGLAVFFAAALLLRRPLSSPLPWFAAFGAALLGELLDMRDDLAGIGTWRWHASVHDLLNTLFWPTIILLLARATNLFGRSR